jgi:hypothetical protein
MLISCKCFCCLGFTGLQVYRFTGLRVYGFTGLQVYRLGFSALSRLENLNKQISQSPHLPISLSPNLPISQSPHLYFFAQIRSDSRALFLSILRCKYMTIFIGNKLFCINIDYFFSHLLHHNNIMIFAFRLM